MSIFYLDTSAWVKRYVQEQGSGWIDSLFQSRQRLASVSLGYVEAVAALSRRISEKHWAAMDAQLTLDWQDMTRLQISPEAIERAASLARQYKLRGADAIHLATALDLREILAELGEPVVLVASDHELLKAAQAAGLAVENPVLAKAPSR